MTDTDDQIRTLRSAQFAERLVARGLEEARRQNLDVAQIGNELLKQAMSILSGVPADQCAPAVATMLRLLKDEIQRIEQQRTPPTMN